MSSGKIVAGGGDGWTDEGSIRGPRGPKNTFFGEETRDFFKKKLSPYLHDCLLTMNGKLSSWIFFVLNLIFC